MATTPNQALPYPSLSDPANGPTAFQALALAIEPKLTMVFQSSAARATALPNPTAGMQCYLKTEALWQAYSGSAWNTIHDARTDYVQSVRVSDGDVAANVPGVAVGPLTLPGGPTGMYECVAMVKFQNLAAAQVNVAGYINCGGSGTPDVQIVTDAATTVVSNGYGVLTMRCLYAHTGTNFAISAGATSGTGNLRIRAGSSLLARKIAN